MRRPARTQRFVPKAFAGFVSSTSPRATTSGVPRYFGRCAATVTGPVNFAVVPAAAMKRSSLPCSFPSFTSPVNVAVVAPGTAGVSAEPTSIVAGRFCAPFVSERRVDKMAPAWTRPGRRRTPATV